MKKNVAYFHEFQEMYLYKDLFLIPYYIAKYEKAELEFCYSYNMGNKEIPERYRNAKLVSAGRVKANKLQRNIDFFRFCTFRAKQINTLFVTGGDFYSMIQLRIIKWLNRSCDIIVFGDMEPEEAKKMTECDFVFSSGVAGFVKRKLVKFFFNNVIYTVANNPSYHLMKEMCNRNGWKCVRQVYPCLDKELFDQYGLKYRCFEDKENIILSVGRIGNYQKNTDMMLEAFKKVDFGNWKVMMVGPITDSFFLRKRSSYEDVINTFFKDRPDLKEKVIFTGPIYDPQKIFELYLQSKIFLLTSRHEGFGNVQSEAAALGCFTVSTDVGGADIVSNNWTFGVKVNQEDPEGLANILNDLITGKLVMNPKNQFPSEKLTWDYMVKENILPYLTHDEYNF